jgi:hypothetical protein
MKSKSSVVTGAPWLEAAALPIRIACRAAASEFSIGAAFILLGCYLRLVPQPSVFNKSIAPLFLPQSHALRR